MIRCASADCSRVGPCSRSTIAAGFRAARTCSGRSTEPRAICRSPRPAAKSRSSSWRYAAAGARSPRSRSCRCRSSTGGRRPKSRAPPPTSPRRTLISPATIARERISAPRSTTRSPAIACSTRSRRRRQPVSVRCSVDSARQRTTMTQNTQIVYVQPPADGALPDPASTFKVVHTPFDIEAVDLMTGEVLVDNQYLSIDPYHRFGLYDPALTRSQFPVTKPGTIISTYGVSRVVRSANLEYAVGDLLYAWVRWERFTVVDEPNLQYLQKVKAGVDP